MNEDVLDGQWKQAKGHVREWWGKVTDDDVDRINGKSEHLVGMLQERYGWLASRPQSSRNLTNEEKHQSVSNTPPSQIRRGCAPFIQYHDTAGRKQAQSSCLTY